MKEKLKENYLKDTPEYEEYSDNVAVLTPQELRELGFACCGSKGNCGNCKGGCSNKKNEKCSLKCCNSK